MNEKSYNMLISDLQGLGVSETIVRRLQNAGWTHTDQVCEKDYAHFLRTEILNQGMIEQLRKAIKAVNITGANE